MALADDDPAIDLVTGCDHGFDRSPTDPNGNGNGCWFFAPRHTGFGSVEASPGIEPGCKDLQSSA